MSRLLLPPPALQSYRFNDLDEFRLSVKEVQIRFTPLARRISTSYAILNLPGFSINLIASFPRILDGQLALGCTAVGFSMDDRSSLVANGRDIGAAFLAIGHGGGGYTAVERQGVRFTSIMFSPEIRDRGWPDPGRDLAFFMIATAARERLCERVLAALKFASRSPDDLNMPGVSRGIRESLLSAIDHAFINRVGLLPIESLHTSRSLSIIRQVEDIVSGNIGNPIYSDELARVVGVSVRTLHNAVREHRGMSLHRYLRLKRLWRVRQRLLEGGVSVKACALANGFWHLGEFARNYHVHFDELPSQTLARAR